VESETGLAVEEAQPDHVAIEEIDQRAKAAGQAGVHVFLDPALDAGLGAAAQASDRVARHEAVFQIQQVHRFAAGVVVVLGGPPGQRVQVVVDQFVPEIDGLAGDLDVFVHPAVFALAAPGAEQAQHPNRKQAAEADALALKGHAPPAERTVDFGAEAGQPLADFRRQRRGQYFVGVDAQHPVGIGIELGQRPVELGGVIDPLALHHARAVRPGDVRGVVGRETVGDQYGVRDAGEAGEAARQVLRFVEGQDDGDELHGFFVTALRL